MKLERLDSFIMRIIKIFDTTLRDGEQAPGNSLTVEEKIEVARALEEMGVDIIEAGFPIASSGDFEAVEKISETVRSCTVAGLARCSVKDIEAAYGALKRAVSPRIHVFIATSPVHMEYKLRKTPEQVIAIAEESVKMARSLVGDVEFSAEDALRSDPEFLVEIYRAAVLAGATTLNIPDTVGYSAPEEYARLVAHLKEEINDEDIVLSTHCHNDLGMAVANSLAGVRAGAGQVECAVAGVGERAGNASLEEVVMAMRTRADYYGAETHVRPRLIGPTARLVSERMGFEIHRNKPIVGRNVFAHESGIHQDGVLKRRETYEIMNPSDVGWEGETLVLGKHSGRNALRSVLSEFSWSGDEEAFEKIFERMKEMADRRKGISVDDLKKLFSI